MTKNFDIENENITFGEWLDYWFETFKKPNLKPYSIRNIEVMIRLHTPKWLKEMEMQKIKVFHLEKALNSLPKSRTRTYARQVWNSAYEKALKFDIVNKNVVILTEKVKYEKKHGSALTMVEQVDFFERIRGTRYEWLMLFYIYSGVRRCEALSLRWEDIRENEQLILIRGTKTEGSFRYIVLTKALKNILIEQKRQNMREVGTRLESKNPELVFPFSAAGVSHHFKEYCPNHHLHDLRHTYITRCAECGINVTVCQQLVGHSTANMTLNVYTHVMDDFKRKEAMKYDVVPDWYLDNSISNEKRIPKVTKTLEILGAEKGI